jgi:ring-1,2-phenylacetyl-CoA epoxidase subunit PaaB
MPKCKRFTNISKDVASHNLRDRKEGDDVTDKTQGFEEYEVFSRKKGDAGLEHRFSLLAPNNEMAFIMAKENFFRREPMVDLWVVRRLDIRKMTPFERDSFTQLDKDYRETRGYADLNARWRAFKDKSDRIGGTSQREEGSHDT